MANQNDPQRPPAGGQAASAEPKAGTRDATGAAMPAQPVQPPVQPTPAVDPRLVYEAMSMFQRSTTLAARPVPVRGDVIVPMTTSSEALGLPTVAAMATIGRDRAPDVRAQVIDALRRNFVAVEHDGVRSYRRLDRPLVQATTAAGRPTQHGLGLFRTASLKSNVLIARTLLLDLRASANTTLIVGAESERRLAVADDAGEDLIRCSADPLGLVGGEAEAAFRRLMLAVADWLDHAGVADADPLRALASVDDLRALSTRLNPGLLVHDHRLGPVGRQEAVARLDALVEALAAIARTIDRGDGTDTGYRAALAEQALTLIRPSAEALVVAYEALGSTRDEQDIAFFGGAGHVSISQFAGWAKRLSDRFAGSEMVVAGMTDADLRVLELELADLKAMGAEIRAASVGSARRLGMIGALGQLEELIGLIANAHQAIVELIAAKQ